MGSKTRSFNRRSHTNCGKFTINANTSQNIGCSYKMPFKATCRLRLYGHMFIDVSVTIRSQLNKLHQNNPISCTQRHNEQKPIKIDTLRFDGFLVAFVCLCAFSFFLILSLFSFRLPIWLVVGALCFPFIFVLALLPKLNCCSICFTEAQWLNNNNKKACRFCSVFSAFYTLLLSWTKTAKQSNRSSQSVVAHRFLIIVRPFDSVFFCVFLSVNIASFCSVNLKLDCICSTRAIFITQISCAVSSAFCVCFFVFGFGIENETNFWKERERNKKRRIFSWSFVWDFWFRVCFHGKIHRQSPINCESFFATFLATNGLNLSVAVFLSFECHVEN